MEKNLKKIALIGQPNVGKSSLFNRIANKRIAIVSDVSGTTRDVRRHEIEIIDRSALLLDTGGIDDTNDEIFSNVKKKAVKTAKEAYIILFIVDGKNIPDDKDKELLLPQTYQQDNLQFYEVADTPLKQNELNQFKQKYRVISIHQNGINVSCRFLSNAAQKKEWVSCQPTIEDSYMYLLSSFKQEVE